MEVSRRLIAWSQGPFPYAGWGLSLVLTIGFVPISEPASSGEWTSQFGSSLALSYEDNPTLSLDEETPNGQFLTTPTLTTRYEEERYRINISANASLVRSTDETVEEDTIRYGSDVDGEYDLEMGVISAAFSVDLESIQNTEFDDTGLLADSADVTSTKSKLTLGFSQELNDTWQLNLDESFDMQSFSGGARPRPA